MIMGNDTRDLLLYARLVDLHHRKTEAALMGYRTKTYETLIELYQMEIAEIEAARLKASQETPDAA
jgi:hypothetical protein